MATIQHQKQTKSSDPLTLKSKTRAPVHPEGEAVLSTLDRKGALSNPQQSRPETILRLQRLAGNDAVQRLLQRKEDAGPIQRASAPEEDEIQTKPLDASSGAPVQREAAPEEDEIQTKPLAASFNATLQREAAPEEDEIQTKPLSASSGRALQREAAPEEDEVQTKPLTASLGTNLQRDAADEEDELQTKRAAAGESFAPGESFETRLNAQQGSGQRLPTDTREFMESRFGVDFGHVHLHNDSAAAQLNREVHAQAFTHGSDIYLGEGKSDLGSDQGKQLLAHELTHVLQQTGGGVQRSAAAPEARQPSGGRKLVVGAAHDPAEQEADQVAEKVVYGKAPVAGPQAAGGPVQAKLQGSYQALHDVSMHGRGWNNILKKLQEYETQEQGQLDKIAALRRVKAQADLLKPAKNSPDLAAFQSQYKTVVEQMGKTQREINDGKRHLLADLQALSKLITAWLNRNKHKRTDEQQKANPQDITVQRRQALEMLLPRVMSEIYAINTNSFGESSISGGQSTTGVKFNAVGGALNRLDLVTYQGGGQAFFKTEKPVDNEYRKLNPISGDMDPGHPGAETGIQEVNPHFGARSVAMARLDALLHANILVKTEFATLVRPDESGGMRARMGIVMEKARGQSVEKSMETGLATDIDNPVLLRGLSKLQMLDALCGQVDRHMGNYFIERNERGEVIGVKGIDNDLSFGAGITDASQRGARQWRGQYRGLPPVVDEELGNALLSISPDVIREALFGLLSQEEIDATLSRLAKLKEELRVLQRNGLFRAANARWSREDIHQMEESSYFSVLQGATESDIVEQCLSFLRGKGVAEARFSQDARTGAKAGGQRLFNLLREKRIPSKDQALAVAERAAAAMVNNLSLHFLTVLDRLLYIEFHIDPLPVQAVPATALDKVD